ncbi:MAG: molybdenum cofactor biosynthesis protein MoaE [Candidatus Marinimicrobia bacterium]|jgi:molybdopterin synthase catalytic subunit|nr:molybdenum cofactor biosynthesis protein MoaE [Candidatus Neomarinimicrobiota bacterium]MDP6853678.1 molybdenum cofactor biosynthesis protein MoaE [Candidatus Neomarinimicrobiota bacterium]MDP6937026.1 molybdenum cofactor biosynthesis protein MoaE [Candidatus Neomarinimicrobiota bacterium]
MLVTTITKNIIKTENIPDTEGDNGAELHFIGKVRSWENEKAITALEYEYYPGMAEKELQKLGEEVLDTFPIQSLKCIHRVGVIPVGEASLLVVIESPHRKEALEAMAYFISTLKKDVPIWKYAHFIDGSREVSECSHG